MIIKLPGGPYAVWLDKPLGDEGGFGAVFEGADADNVPLAVKQLKVDAADLAGRELEISDSLKSRTLAHVMPVIDSGTDSETDRVYIVMPRAETDLQHFINDKGPADVTVCASIMLQIAQGLEEVIDIVHRDLKPANVLFYQNAWRVADFGIARWVAEATATKTLKGFRSEAYAAPEIWDDETATNATDIYSLGCIAFFLLTGEPPFRENLEEAHRRIVPPPLPTADFRLKGLVGHMLRKRADTRPSLEHVVRVLRSVLAEPLNEPVFSELAAIGAQISAADDKRIAHEKAVERAVQARLGMFNDALDELARIQYRLADKLSSITSSANARKQPPEACTIEIRLGLGLLTISGHRTAQPIQQSMFLQAGWDVITHGSYKFVQKSPAFEWGASLWFAKIDSQPHRWYDVSYCTPSHRGTIGKCVPRMAISFEEADHAFRNSTLKCSMVYLPRPIDGDQEGDFQRRMISLFVKGSVGQLAAPEVIPWGEWPFPTS